MAREERILEVARQRAEWRFSAQDLTAHRIGILAPGTRAKCDAELVVISIARAGTISGCSPPP